MKPLWKIRLGKFAGWRCNDRLYNVEGKNVVFFDDNIAYSLDGRYIGEVYRKGWIGKRTAIIRPPRGARAPFAGTALAPYINRVGLAIADWEDSDF